MLSDKFKKELEKFFEWVSVSGYVISDYDEVECEWSDELLSEFEEPSRNKLEMYIKGLFYKYVIIQGSEEITDAKLLTKEFKEAPKVTKAKKEKVEVKKAKKEKVEVKKAKKEKVEEEEKPKKAKKEKVEELERQVEVVVDPKLDTSKTYYMDTIDYTTDELKSVFGEPMKTGDESDEWCFEWKLSVREKGKDDEIYTIYDWEDCEGWHIGGVVENIETIKQWINLNKN